MTKKQAMAATLALRYTVNFPCRPCARMDQSDYGVQPDMWLPGMPYALWTLEQVQEQLDREHERLKERIRIELGQVKL